jgi:hypothetical protein
MTLIRIIGIFLLVLGLGMFYWGVTTFSWQGPGLSEFMSKLGKYSFFLWLPTVFIGISLIVAGRRKKV